MTISIPKEQAVYIGLMHQSLSAAREYSRSLAVDPNLHRGIQSHFNNVSASISIILSKLDERIPKGIRSAYSEQIANADPLPLENIKSLYMSMDQAQRETLENVAEAILKRNFILEQID